MGLVISGEWQNIINARVTRYTGSVNDLVKKQIGWAFVREALEIYVVAAEKAMGSVDARGGMPSIDFEGAAVEKWAPLSIYTVAIKNGLVNEEEAKLKLSEDVLSAAWALYSSTPIWEDTGSARESLSISDSRGAVTVSSYAEVVDEGGTGTWGKPVPARPLFSVLNEGFLDYIRKEIKSGNSTFYRKVRKEMKDALSWK